MFCFAELRRSSGDLTFFGAQAKWTGEKLGSDNDHVITPEQYTGMCALSEGLY